MWIFRFLGNDVVSFVDRGWENLDKRRYFFGELESWVGKGRVYITVWVRR